MNVFETHSRIVNDYASYIKSFISISDEQIENKVRLELAAGKLWPQPLLHFNPSYEQVGTIKEVVDSGLLSREAKDIFKGYSLYRHQVEAIKQGIAGRDFVVTSGTGSGKSLTYIASIFDSLLRAPNSEGIMAIVVYPMNALINSQTNELGNYRNNYQDSTGEVFPISFGQYTGQEKQDVRENIREKPPQILLTNYMMLELLLTRGQERGIRDAIYKNLKFLVFDELHTYRGRQGSDIAMLIRRIRAMCMQPITCIGTSATLISEGSQTDRKQKVAAVATKIFGKEFAVDQIVEETLTRSLGTETIEHVGTHALKTLTEGIDPELDEAVLRGHPLATWLENRIALEDVGGVLSRRTPLPVDEVVTELSVDSGKSEETCREALAKMLLWISNVNQKIQNKGSRYTILPYKLHQFFAQTGSVYTTLDQEPEQRIITLEPGLFQENSKDKLIYPNVFSRESGHPYICVSIVGDRMYPREFREFADEELEADDGYLIVGDDIWDPETDMEYLPDAWVRVRATGRMPEKKYEPLFPRRVYFDRFGNCSTLETKEYWGWFMKAPLLFDPTAGTFFDLKTNESTKLTKLGSEGRSTSTTITTFSILNRLNEAGLNVRDQKLLSFTDNRQDAALQAGHFNDFLSVVQLRSAIYRAIANEPNNEMDFSRVGKAVFDALGLEYSEFANGTVPAGLAYVQRRFDDALQTYLLFRSLADLRRSWRIVLPNLEQCGLLNVKYKDLEELVSAHEFWADMPIVRELGHGDRLDFLTTILDFFRYEQAIYSENYLERDRLKEFEKQFRETLKAPWTLGRNERLQMPAVIRMDPLNRNSGLYSKSVGPTSGVGKWLKHIVKTKGLNQDDVRGENYRTFMLTLMKKLAEADFLFEKSARNERGEDIPLFQLRIDRILWALGDGETVRPDVIKRRSYKNRTPRPNAFFKGVYENFKPAKRLHAGDHTGQLNVDDRIDREERFRAEWVKENDKNEPDIDRIKRDSISALFCSPTMELGVDIGGLSVVHMRNAPPNPANYAQRSGRAGRSGQGALIFTYCSSYSPHDRHYFQMQAALVAGAVQPPRIELVNKELLQTHLNALAISEIGMPGLDGREGQAPSLVWLVDLQDVAKPITESVAAGLKLSNTSLDRISAAYKRTISDFRDDLEAEHVVWYTDDWIKRNLDRLSENLDQSMKRWREIYKSAELLLRRATQTIEGGLLQVHGDEYKKLKRLQDQSTRQLNLLRNEQSGSGELSEFYPYRYLAAEGFFPGYNFTRLPVRVFVPEGNTSGEFISRPRSVGLREFGPLNLIYHKGQKYKVSQMVVQDADAAQSSLTISKASGYALTDDHKSDSRCPFSDIALDNTNKFELNPLLELSECRAEEVDRISCEEEERTSRGFEIKTYFTVDGDGMDRVKKAAARSNEATLLNLRYIPAARLIHVNNKWRSQKIEGFPFGMTSGNWSTSMPDPAEEAREDTKLVKLWTSNTADALYVEPVQALGLNAEGVITLQYALKRAIETVFQAEPNEIGVMTMGDGEAPNILIYEAAEGSLGILSQFVEVVEIFNKVVETAIKICRYDDDSYLAPASYDDLLSYYNQRDHISIDRFLIKDALEKLRIATIEIESNKAFANYEEHYQRMRQSLDPNSSTELKFIEYLHANGFRLPDSAQKRVEGIYCQPDFFYEPNTWIFCDGTPHDEPETRKRDDEQRQQIISMGHEPWVWHYKEDLAAKVARRPDIFKKVK